MAALLLAGTYLLGVFKGWDLIGAFVLLIAGYLAIWLLGLLHLRSHPSQTTEDR